MLFRSIPRSLPFIRREAVKALKTSYATQESAADGIALALRDFYRAGQSQVLPARQRDVERAIAASAG